MKKKIGAIMKKYLSSNDCVTREKRVGKKKKSGGTYKERSMVYFHSNNN